MARALALGAGDSWTLTDWFESIYIRQAGVEAYDTLFSPEGNWTDPSVSEAINTMLELLTDENIAGGKEGALATTFTDGIGLVFSPDAEATMYYEGGFVGGIAVGDVNPDLVWEETIGFFPFPSVGDERRGRDHHRWRRDGRLHQQPGRGGVHAVPRQPRGRGRLGRGWDDHHSVRRCRAADYPDARAQAEAEHVYGAGIARYDGADLLAAGTDLGASLQAIFDDPSILDSQMETFQAEADAAWAEAGS